MCCNSWGHQELDTTEQLNCIELFFLNIPETVFRWCLSIDGLISTIVKLYLLFT